MHKLLQYVLKFNIFWLIYFFVLRITFLAFNFSYVRSDSFFEIFKVFYKGFSLDLSFIAYLVSLNILLLFFNSFFMKPINQFLESITHYINILFIFLTSLISAGEINLYGEWLSKINFTALSHFENPSEVIRTSSSSHYLITILCILVGFSFFKIYKSWFRKYKIFNNHSISLKKSLINLLLYPLLLGLMLIVIRGGVQPIPINMSDAYFSNSNTLNDIAVNQNWNFFQSILKNRTNLKGNPYKKFSVEDVEYFKDKFEDTSTSKLEILDNKNPNIVFIILESWSSDCIKSLEGLSGITPNFDTLVDQGYLFTDFYSNGFTSDQGMSSIFSSFPSFPSVNIIQQSDKSRLLPTINKKLSNHQSSFFFGGQLTYGNIKGYLLSNGFDIVKDELNYKHLPSGGLGVHDEFMFNQFLTEIDKLNKPFFTTLFTISSHSPYDHPGERNISFSSREDPYVNSVAYTDKFLGDFMRKVKLKDYYKNTLFIIVSDHSHNSPIKRRVAEKERFKIPMLWYGEPIKPQFRGKKNKNLGSHFDIAKSLLNQMDIESSEFIYSRDLFSETKKRFVPFVFPKGYAMIQNEGYYAFSETYNKVIESPDEDEIAKVLKKDTELFFQISFDEYLKLGRKSLVQ